MPSDLEALPITGEEIDELVNFSPDNTLAIDIYRAFILHKPNSFLSVLLTELFALILLLIFVAPVSLLVLRNSDNLSEDLPDILQIFTVILGLCLLGVSIWNAFLWKRAKQMKSLARLLDEIDKYNGVIQTLTLIDELESVGNSLAGVYIRK